MHLKKLRMDKNYFVKNMFKKNITITDDAERRFEAKLMLFAYNELVSKS